MKEKSNVRSFCFMCYNVRNCKGADDEVSYERVASIINKQRPLFVGVQELDSMTHRYPNQYVLANLAEMTGMKATFCRAIEYRAAKSPQESVADRVFRFVVCQFGELFH